MKKSLAWGSVGSFVLAVMVASCAQGSSDTSGGGDDTTADAAVADDASAGSDAHHDGGGDAGTCPTACTGATPFCDPASKKCVVCLPTNDTCTAGTYCIPSATNGYVCGAGCATVADCTGSDAGGGGGDAGDAGPAVLSCCGHVCVDVTSNATNCGMCGTACSMGHITSPVCAASSCSGTCDVGYADCNANKQTDGCEVATGTDPMHCGGCTTACSSANITTPTCAAGVCTGACAAGFADCNANKQTDGCEKSLTSLTDCATCGTPCAPANAIGATCAAMSCDYGSCNTGYQDCDANRHNGCESNKNTDSANCGSCNHACTTGQSCVNGTCAAAHVLLAASDDLTTIQAMAAALQATGAFSGVDSLVVSTTVPTVAQLQAYSAVLSWTQTPLAVANETTFYDNLATYFDGGGRVVLATFVIGGYPNGAVGRFLVPANGYMLFNVTSSGAFTSGGALTLGSVFEPASPLMTGVTTVTQPSTSYWSTSPVMAGATVVANWSNSIPMIVRGTVNGRKRVDINMWPKPASFGGDAITVFKNALLYQ